MIFTQLSLFSLLAVFASSAVAAMGLGGGTVLLLYLSFFSALSQPQMQAVNLLLLPCILGGVLGGIAGSLLSNLLEPNLLRKAFGVFLLLIGLRELLLCLKSLRKNFSHPKA